ncbi:MAG: N-acetyl-gamma-glutamyl-phosphate reductase [Thermodesulfovibrionales bacterium]
MLKVAICGGSGYAGAELLRVLMHHPSVRVVAATSQQSAGVPVAEHHPHLHGYRDLVLEPLDRERLVGRADVFFMALPHAASQEAVAYFFKNGKKVIDLSADYRLRDASTYEKWYRTPHGFRGALRRAVYGLPEIYRGRIRKASLVANPGCYPTGAILGLYPALKAGLIDPASIVIDSKSGASGAGRKAELALSFCEVDESVRAYAVASHRHTPEIEQEVSAIARRAVTVNFTPHLLPVERGILSTMYARLARGADTGEVRELYRKTYRGEPFVRVLDGFPNIKNVRGTNLCEVGLAVNERTGTLIAVTAIDNLMKGAAGQAVHNMNIMLGLEETAGLQAAAVYP